MRRGRLERTVIRRAFELQKIARRVARSPRGLRRNPCEASPREIEAVNEGVDEANGVVGADVIVNGLRQEQELGAFESGNVSHAGFYCAAGGSGIRRRNFSRVFIQSGPLLHAN
jgi:hypothetical protein